MDAKNVSFYLSTKYFDLSSYPKASALFPPSYQVVEIENESAAGAETVNK